MENKVVLKPYQVSFKKKKSVVKPNNDLKTYQKVLAAEETLFFPEIDASYRKKKRVFQRDPHVEKLEVET